MTISPGRARRQKEKENAPLIVKVAKKVQAFFNSLYLTLFVFLSLAALSIIGTVVEQHKPVEEYIAAFGEKWTIFILNTGMDDVFHTWWYNLFLGLLVVNVIACTFTRFPSKWKVLAKDNKVVNPKMVNKLANKLTFEVGADTETARETILNYFNKKKFKTMSSPVEATEERGRGHSLYAWKGKNGRYGPEVIHISILIVLGAAMYGSIYGYTDFRNVLVGGDVEIPQADFKLSLKKFWIDYYDTGQIRQYNSILAVIEDGKEVYEEKIWVNSPMYYKGIRFYQSSFGSSWNKLDSAMVAVRDTSSKELGKPVAIKWGEKTDLPGSEYSVKLVGYAADFAFDERSKTVYSKSMDANNPAIWLEIFKDGMRVSAPWVFIKYPGIFSNIPNANEEVVFLDFQEVPFSGISINKDPGTNYVWVGCIIMGVGFIMSFFIYYRRIWINVTETDGGTEVSIGGMINKNQLAFEMEFNNMVKTIQAELGGKKGGS